MNENNVNVNFLEQLKKLQMLNSESESTKANNRKRLKLPT